MRNELAHDMAERAAALLPEPPEPHDAFGYLAWEELVLSTARQLQRFIDDADLRTPPSPETVLRAVESDRLSAGALLVLAALLVHDDTASVCSELLAGSLSG